jgi:hypothetical protein
MGCVGLIEEEVAISSSALLLVLCIINRFMAGVSPLSARHSTFSIPANFSDN